MLAEGLCADLPLIKPNDLCADELRSAADFRSDRGDFETKTNTRTQRILALHPKQNRHQDFVKPSSNQCETDLQPAPSLSTCFIRQVAARLGVPAINPSEPKKTVCQSRRLDIW
jgi:hypothetical protein